MEFWCDFVHSAVRVSSFPRQGREETVSEDPSRCVFDTILVLYSMLAYAEQLFAVSVSNLILCCFGLVCLRN